jgi:geranylgeranyl diphosphate synthase type II
VYGESTATLAGDALHAAAFETLLASKLPPGAVVEMGRVLSEAAGPRGICGGQYLDIYGEGKRLTQDELETINIMKTASLISAAARIGTVAAGGTREQIKAAGEYALAVGLAFQIRDDMLDVTATAAEFGKPVGSDDKNEKTTFATLLGAERCEDIIRAETEKAIKAVDGKFNDARFLIWLAYMLAERKY